VTGRRDRRRPTGPDHLPFVAPLTAVLPTPWIVLDRSFTGCFSMGLGRPLISGLLPTVGLLLGDSAEYFSVTSNPDAHWTGFATTNGAGCDEVAKRFDDYSSSRSAEPPSCDTTSDGHRAFRNVKELSPLVTCLQRPLSLSRPRSRHTPATATTRPRCGYTYCLSSRVTSSINEASSAFPFTR
jgi:hypothetical protein